MRLIWKGWPIELSERLAAQADWERRRWRTAIVALESTVVTHGLPYPQNLELVDQIQTNIRQKGAQPALLAIIDGVITVDPDSAVSQRLAEQGARVFRKCNLRDLSLAVAERWNGSLTVSAVMEVAHGLGFRVFVTGGIGGVHRDFTQNHDASADLTALARIPVCVVCAGVKSVLDIGATLERLETDAVPAIVFNSSEFPAFWCRRSGYAAPARLDTVEQVATVLRLHLLPLLSSARVDHDGECTNAERLPCGMLVAVPIPAEAECSESETAIQQALAEATQRGIRGKALTPFLLERVAALTQGASVRANMALLLHNASFGAALASVMHHSCHGLPLGSALRRYQHQQHQHHQLSYASITGSRHTIDEALNGCPSDDPEQRLLARNGPVHDDSSASLEPALDADAAQPELAQHPKQRLTADCGASAPLRWLPVTVLGHWTLDIYAFASSNVPFSSNLTAVPASYPGVIRSAYGGVGYNIALTLSYLAGGGASPYFTASEVMRDAHLGRLAESSLTMANERRLGTFWSTRHPAATYVAVHNEARDLLFAVFDGADITPAMLGHVNSSRPIVWDANLTPAAMAALPRASSFWYEPTSPAKAGRIVAAQRLEALPWMSPNELELIAIAQAAGFSFQEGAIADDGSISDALITAAAAYLVNTRGVRNILVTQGARGVTWFYPDAGALGGIASRHFDAIRVEKSNVRSTTGAGDVFAAAVIFALCGWGPAPPLAPAQAISFGLEAAAIACQYETAVPPADALRPIVQRMRRHRL
ncbi:similar to indigoidine systhesis protein IdgA [Cyanidioschyzon merolae strain 10D]|uniref:Similar to indigoidine systhesis protein IdgA n=1 Tax=Cyanidioschyzon merolae (strain NIES-3377 / 10D) TaxID=280699 RepID=M1VGI5_CYAM1|nr:similar to indigoidine systhesis protein IdgA [Cyanidioschyzon merolae strain 10D]BAM79793.1 similar to indigoidine systhesis protein IdgA [Cyanidioschyzon merolae strain 10D]|eukprot:XP_005536079.1 similar to indigoidine systhesis protein IdgA [Cyanidioschyzon merolae strain 10D]